VAEDDQKAHQPLDGEAFELVIEQGGYLGLIDCEGRSDFGLREATPLDNAADGGSEAGLGVELDGIRQIHIGEDVDAARNYSLCGSLRHISPRSYYPNSRGGTRSLRENGKACEG